MPRADAGSQGRQRRPSTAWTAPTGCWRAPRRSPALGSAFAPLVNAAAGQPHRPLAAGEAVRRVAAAPAAGLRPPQLPAPRRRRGWTRKPRPARPRVAYFVDVFANYNDPLIAEAVVAVLHHNGIEVYVPPGQLGCGMAPLAYGDVETARETVQHNLRVLADLAREGYADPLLRADRRPHAAPRRPRPARRSRRPPGGRRRPSNSRPSCGTCTSRAGCAPTSSRWTLSVGHHVPCHLKALGRPPAGPALLR